MASPVKVLCPAMVLLLVTVSLAMAGEPDPNVASDPPSVRHLSLDDLGSSFESGPEDEEAGLLADLDENLRVQFDVGSRFKLNVDTDDIALRQFGGVNALKVFSDDTGDWASLVAQVYLVRIDDYAMAPRFFEGEDDWELLIKTLNLNYTGIGNGKFNIRVGHFELPYGLEVNHDTVFTLRQFTNERNLGLLRDWGVSLNGDLPDFEYEVALSRGSGSELSARGDPWALSGRIGTPREENVVLGFSAFTGDVQIPARGGINTMERWRVGVDAEFAFGPFSLLGQSSVGENWNMEFYDHLLELNWHDPEEQWRIYLQGVFEHREYMPTAEDYLALYFGVTYAPDTSWVLSGQFKQYLETFHNYPEDGFLTFQLRYRF